MTAFYEPLDDAGRRWRATVHTTGPWSQSAQHGGPPSALLARAAERVAPRPEMVVARVTVEILGAVPVGDVEVHARVARAGRSVELLESELTAAGRTVARAALWRVLRATGDGVPSRSPAPPALPEHALEQATPPGWVDGYLSAVQWRPVSGSFAELGPCTVWARLRVPLVPGEQPSPLQRVLAVADSGNGLSRELPVSMLFINPELTVHLHREAVGEWICVDAVTAVSPGGAGLATTRLSDADGPIGVGAQALLVRER